MSEKNFDELEVGGVYENRGGNEVTITTFDADDDDLPYRDNFFNWYTRTGKWLADRADDHPYNLVRRVDVPTSTAGPLDFRINTAGNEDYSRAVQERLFELGYSWLAGAGPRHLKANWLFARGYRGRPASLTFGDHPCDSDFPVITLTDLFVSPPVSKPDPEEEKLMINLALDPAYFNHRTLTRAQWRVIRDRINEAIDGGA